MVLRRIVASGWLVTASVAWAHPGHGTTDARTVEHYSSEWVHAGPLLLACVGCVAGLGILWGLTKQRIERESR